MLMRKIYVSDSGQDKNDGLSNTTPIRSWQRFIELCAGNDEIIIMGTDKVRMRLIAEIDKKRRLSQMPAPKSASEAWRASTFRVIGRANRKVYNQCLHSITPLK